MKNAIEQNDPTLALVREVQALEQQFEQLKVGSQVPSIRETGLGAVSFSIAARSGNTPFSHTVLATLSPDEGTPKLFAYPQFSVFLNDPGNPDLETLFPYYEPGIGFGVWGNSTYKRYEHILDVNQWFSWGRTNNSNLVACLHIARHDHAGIGIAEADNNPDGTTTASLPLDVYLQWRYIRPGAS